MYDKLSDAQIDADAIKYNRKYAVAALTVEILRNGSSLMTTAEAKAKAEKLYDQGIRP